MTKVEQIHNLAVKMAAQAYLDLWLSADHVEAPKELVDSTLAGISDLEIDAG